MEHLKAKHILERLQTSIDMDFNMLNEDEVVEIIVQAMRDSDEYNNIIGINE